MDAANWYEGILPSSSEKADIGISGAMNINGPMVGQTFSPEGFSIGDSDGLKVLSMATGSLDFTGDMQIRGNSNVVFAGGNIVADRLVLDGAFSNESPGTLEWEGGTLEVNEVVVQGGGLFSRMLGTGTLAPARDGDGVDGPALDIQLGGKVNAWLGNAAEHFEDVSNAGTLLASGGAANFYTSFIGGDYIQSSTGAVEMCAIEEDPGDVAIAGRLDVAGTATLGGALLWDKSASETWEPYAAGKVNILQAGAINGRFAFVRDAETFGPVRYQRDGWRDGDTFGLVVEYDTPGGAVTAQLARVGDVDLDQDVDETDFGQMLAGLETWVGQGQFTTWEQGNINGDPITDGYDLFEFVEILATEVTTSLPDLIYNAETGDLSIDLSEMANLSSPRIITSYQIAANDPSKIDGALFERPLQRADFLQDGVVDWDASYATVFGELFEFNPDGAIALFNAFDDDYTLGLGIIDPFLSQAEYLSLFDEARWSDDLGRTWGTFDLEYIPEPATLVLIGIGASLAVSRRRAAVPHPDLREASGPAWGVCDRVFNVHPACGIPGAVCPMGLWRTHCLPDIKASLATGADQTHTHDNAGRADTIYKCC